VVLAATKSHPGTAPASQAREANLMSNPEDIQQEEDLQHLSTLFLGLGMVPQGASCVCVSVDLQPDEEPCTAAEAGYHEHLPASLAGPAFALLNAFVVSKRELFTSPPGR
jgi:hypothetical protein